MTRIQYNLDEVMVIKSTIPVYRRTAGTYFGTAEPGRKNYRYCQTVSRFPPDDLQSDKASL